MNLTGHAEESTKSKTRVTLSSHSPERTSESESESPQGCQGYQIGLADDTSHSSSIPESYLTEYKIRETTEEMLKYGFSDQSSEKNHPGNNLFSVNSEVDAGLLRSDYLDFKYCLLCKTDQKNINYPYCSICFTLKKNLFPSRPKRCKGSRKKSKLSSKGAVDFKKSGVIQEEEVEVVQNKSKGSLSDKLFEGGGVQNTKSKLSKDTVDIPSQTSASCSTEISSTNSSSVHKFEPCRVCFLKPENGLFIHTKLAHRYGCYTCANQIWYCIGCCPLCRKKVFKVTKLYL